MPFRTLFDSLRQDLHYAVRTLRHNAGFTAFAILIIGLGVGASSTVFSIVNSLLIQPLPFTDSKRLVWIYNLADDGVSEWQTQVGHYLDMRELNKSFSDLTAYFTSFEPGNVKVTGDGATARISGLSVAQNFFRSSACGPQPGPNVHSRRECKWNAPGAAIVSYGLWKQRYASDPNIIGRTLTLNDKPYTIVGVAPASFDFGTVFAPGSHIDVYFPMPLTQETNNWGNTLAVVARLRPGVTLERARAEFRILADQLQREHPRRNTLRPILTTFDEHVTGRVRRAVVVLAWAVAIVMLIVCANIANLQLARGATRRREMSIRVAVGAGRARLVRQMLTEGVALSGCGALLGLLLAIAGTRLVAGLDAFKIPLLSMVKMDASSLGFALLVSVLAGLLFGLAPVLQIPFTFVHDSLKDSSRSASSTKQHIWLQDCLVVSEIVFACMLLVGAGLLGRSFLNVLSVNFGFRPEQAAALRIDRSSADSAEAARNTFYERVLSRAKSVPGVSEAGLTDVLPLVGDRSWDVSAKGRVFERGHYPEGFIRIVSHGYLRAMGIPLLEGRDFSERDDAASEPVALVNETLAHTLWPGQDAVGQIVLVNGSQRPGRRVVGVVRNVRHRSLEQESGCEVYMPIGQRGDYGAVYLVLRSGLAPEALTSSMRLALRGVAPQLGTNELIPLQEVVDRAVSSRRFVALLLSGFSGFALILAGLGIYAVISYSVNQRTTEMGIRMALGASTHMLQTRVLLQALRLAGYGTALGGLAAWFLSRILGSLLFGVTAKDPETFAAMLLALGAAAAVAGYLPALRISRIEPMSALRAS